jgi:hypothetical protein
MTTMTFEEKVANDLIVAGEPEYLVERFEHFRQELGIGHLLIQGHESKMDHPTTMRSIELIGKQVIPALAKG